MNDEELLSKLAAIEGCEWGEYLENYDECWWLMNGHYWDPLTIPGDALGLVEKYYVECKWASDREQWRATIYEVSGRIIGHGMDMDLSRAICLAVVEAHKC